MYACMFASLFVYAREPVLVCVRLCACNGLALALAEVENFSVVVVDAEDEEETELTREDLCLVSQIRGRREGLPWVWPASD